MSKTDDVAGEFYMLDWTSEVDKDEAYIAALDYIISFYKSNSYFRLDVARSTAKVLGKDSTSSESESGKQVKEDISVLKVELSKLFRFPFLELSYHFSVNGLWNTDPFPFTPNLRFKTHCESLSRLRRTIFQDSGLKK